MEKADFFGIRGRTCDFDCPFLDILTHNIPALHALPYRVQNGGIVPKLRTQEVLDRHTTQEADTLTVSLLRYRQIKTLCECTHRTLLHPPNREQRLRKNFFWHRPEEVGLVLLPPTVVPHGDIVGPLCHGVAIEYAKLHFSIAHHVRIGCAAHAILGEQIVYDPLLILGARVERLKGNVEAGGYPHRVLPLPGPRARDPWRIPT